MCDCLGSVLCPLWGCRAGGNGRGHGRAVCVGLHGLCREGGHGRPGGPLAGGGALAMATAGCCCVPQTVTSHRTSRGTVLQGLQAHQAMAGSFTHLLVLLSIFQCVVRVGDKREEATQELLHQHEEQQRQQMAWLLEEVEEIEQRSQLLDEMEQSSQDSVLLSACQHWWFWALADVLLMVFAFFWLPRQRTSASDSSDTEEPPKEPKSRRRRRRRNRMRGSTTDHLDPIRSFHQHPDSMDMQNLCKKHGGSR